MQTNPNKSNTITHIKLKQNLKQTTYLNKQHAKPKPAINITIKLTHNKKHYKATNRKNQPNNPNKTKS